MVEVVFELLVEEHFIHVPNPRVFIFRRWRIRLTVGHFDSPLAPARLLDAVTLNVDVVVYDSRINVVTLQF